MGHHSFLTVGHRSFLLARDGYDSELAALFTEAERVFLPAADGDDEPTRYGYFVSAGQLRQRLHAQGFTSTRAMAELRTGIGRWRDDAGNGGIESLTGSPGEPPPGADELVAALRDLITGPSDSLSGNDLRDVEVAQYVDELWGYMETRSLVRVLVDAAPDGTEVGLDLHELIGCCVEMDPGRSVAASARAAQVAAASTNAPLIVLTEGSSDSRLLGTAMAVTHPHLVGFVRFIDFAGVGGAEGSVGALSRTVYSFVAAGVANRFVAIADNDTEGHAGLARLKNESLPANCRVTHYPDLPSLSSYPTLGPQSPEPVLANVNGCAGSLEMYLGHDVLTIDGELAPVQWRSYHTGLKRYHGTLLDRDKNAVQDAFKRKVDRALSYGRAPESDWTGVHMIIEHIVHAFD